MNDLLIVMVLVLAGALVIAASWFWLTSDSEDYIELPFCRCHQAMTVDEDGIETCIICGKPWARKTQ